MVTNEKVRPPQGAGAGLPSKTSVDLESFFIAQKHAPAQAGSRARPQRLVAKLWQLGPAPLDHFIREIEAGGAIDTTLETYAALPADLIRAYHGDRFMPSTFLVREDGAA